MKTTLLIDAAKDAIHAALLEDGVATEYYIARANEGALYRARVKTVEPKINAAFLDIGEAEVFLPFRNAKALNPDAKTILDAVHEGETVLVKLKSMPYEDDKLPIATANPMMAGRYALTGHLPGRALLARRLEKHPQLQTLLDEMDDGRSLIVRTNAKAVPATVVKDEIAALQDIWEKADKKGKPGIVIDALDPLEKTLRDHAPGDITDILINDRIAANKARKLAEEKWPELQDKISFYDEPTPIMEVFGVADKIDAALCGKIRLPSGGALMIDDAAGMTVIDVNSGAGHKGASPETLYLATNMEAAKAVANELRFQNLGGLILVDFIDMKSRTGHTKVLAALDEALARDPVPVERTNINRFGGLTIKRKRRGMNLKQALEANP